MKANGEYEAYKQKKNSSQNEKRDRIKVGLQQLPKAEREKIKRLNREYSRKKMAECRRRKKGLSAEIVVQSTAKTSPNTSENGYKTASALSKAFTKLKRALPSAPAKKKQLATKLLRTFNDTDQQEIVANKSTEVKATRGVPQSVIEMVKAFYERDDISRMSPNTKDCRKFVNPTTGLKEIKLIRFLMYTLSDVYSMFVKHIRNGKSCKF